MPQPRPRKITPMPERPTLADVGLPPAPAWFAHRGLVLGLPEFIQRNGVAAGAKVVRERREAIQGWMALAGTDLPGADQACDSLERSGLDGFNAGAAVDWLEACERALLARATQ